MYNCLRILKATNLYTLNGWIIWHGNNSIKLLKNTASSLNCKRRGKAYRFAERPFLPGVCLCLLIHRADDVDDSAVRAESLLFFQQDRYLLEPILVRDWFPISFFKFFINVCTFYCAGSPLLCRHSLTSAKRGYFSLQCTGLLIAVASLSVEHRL